MSAIVTTNPLIDVSGATQVSAGQNCRWTTKSDGNATMTIINISKINQCRLSISGAPSSATVILNGGALVPMNGIFSIPSNTPNYSIVCFGDFGGAIITITNITNSQNDATANILVI